MSTTVIESAVVERTVNQIIRVEGWNRVYIERELYFNLEDFFYIQGLRFGSGKLSLTVDVLSILLIGFTALWIIVKILTSTDFSAFQFFLLDSPTWHSR